MNRYGKLGLQRPLSAAVGFCAGLFGAWASNASADDDVSALTRPDSSVSVGVGTVSQDNTGFGQFNGLNKQDPYGLLDIDLRHRNDDTGTWLNFSGRNLGLDSRELHLENLKQGDWGYFVDYNEIPAVSRYTINTSTGGIGGLGNQQTVGNPAVIGSNFNLETKRKIWTLGGDKALPAGLDFHLTFRNEDKEGYQMWSGQVNAITFLAQPINYNTKQVEASLGYGQGPLHLSGGYYGSEFTDKISALYISPQPTGTFLSPAPLAPSNQSHQLFLSGNYDFSRTTHANFKTSYTTATQDSGFVYGNPTGTLLSFNPDLDGKVNTFLGQAGFTMRPTQKSTLVANLRYEDRKDETPQNPYVTSSGLNLFNPVYSRATTNGKVEGGYQLPWWQLRALVGVDIAETTRTTPDVRTVSWRTRNNEHTYRLELARAMSETLNGRLAFLHSVREGSQYLPNTKGTSAYTTTLAPFEWDDRKRNSVRLSVDWTPLERLSTQFVAETGHDNYSFTGLQLGPSEGKEEFYSVDAAYTLSDKLKGNIFASHNYARMDQVNIVNGTTTVDANGNVIPDNTLWGAELRNIGDTLGFGLTAKPVETVELGTKLLLTYDRTKQDMSLGNGAPITQLPNYYNRLFQIQTYSSFAIKENQGIRVDLVYDRRTTNDWTWNNFTFPQDGTTVQQNTNQNVIFVGVSYYLKFQLH